MATIRPRAPRTLVWGGSGFLGAHVLRAARDRGHEIVSASRRPAPPSAAGVASAKLVASDLTDVDDVVRVLGQVEPQLVVLCAALSRIDEAERDPSGARALNVEAPAAVARWTRMRRERGHEARLVHVSTDLVFGGAPPRASGYHEDDAVDPRSEYGRTKAAGERAVLQDDPRAMVVRLPLLFGDSFGRGAGASDALIAAVTRAAEIAAVASDARPKLFVDEWRTPIDVAVAARAIVRLTEGDEAGIWHVGGRERIDRWSLGVRVLRDAGLVDPERLVVATTRAEAGFAARPADVSLDSSRVRGLVGPEILES